MANEHTISALCQRSRDISLEKGWLNPDGSDPRPFYTVTGLFHTELSEAFEDIRSNKGINEIYYEAKFKESDGSTSKEIVSSADIAAARKVEGKYGRGRDFLDAKPCGFPVELADFVIRVAQYYGSAGRGQELSKLVEGTMVLPATEKVKDVEELVTLLHLDVSFAFAAQRGALKGTSLMQDALAYHASALIAVFEFCEKNDINLWAAIDEKEAYNRTRPTRHGGKKH